MEGSRLRTCAEPTWAGAFAARRPRARWASTCGRKASTRDGRWAPRVWASAQDGGGAWASGLADTRNLYTLLDLPDMPGVEPEDVVCAYLESLGLPCIDCGDGVDRCLYMEAYFDDAALVEGVTLDPDPTGSGR